MIAKEGALVKPRSPAKTSGCSVVLVADRWGGGLHVGRYPPGPAAGKRGNRIG